MKPLNLVALLLFLGGVVWVFTLSEDAVRKIQKTYYSAISPIVSQGSKTEKFAREFVKEVEHSEDLEKRLEQTIRERERYKVFYLQVRNLEAENNELRDALEFQKRTQFDVMPAQVIRRQPQFWGQTIEIDRGEEKGLSKNLCVLASNGGLVGRVHLPGENVSSVLLVTDQDAQIAARVEGSSEIGFVVGRRTNYNEPPELRLRYLSKNPILAKGMKVFTDGRGKLFPADIPIGTIEDFKSGPVQGEAKIKPFVDFKHLETVFVITRHPGD